MDWRVWIHWAMKRMWPRGKLSDDFTAITPNVMVDTMALP